MTTVVVTIATTVAITERKYQVFCLELTFSSSGAAWLSGNVVGHINKVTLPQAGLVLIWVTFRRYTVLVFNQATQANSA